LVVGRVSRMGEETINVPEQMRAARPTFVVAVPYSREWAGVCGSVLGSSAE
jgi:hypothetical protein